MKNANLTENIYICPYVQKEILQHVSDIQKEISQANKGILC